jgi:ribonuclease P protein component
MRRSADFGATVKYGRRAAQPDIVMHARRVNESANGTAPGPRIGLIIAKSVGTSVQRHRVARRLRHIVRGLLGELGPGQQLVIRALPGSSHAESARLERQLRAGLQRIGQPGGAGR